MGRRASALAEVDDRLRAAVPDGNTHSFVGDETDEEAVGASVMTFRHLTAYHIAKEGLEDLVRMAADELEGSGLRVNAIRPRLTRSGATNDMFEDGSASLYMPEYPLGRLDDANDMAGAVRFLAGDESLWVTGQFIAVDGGNMLRRRPRSCTLADGQSGPAGKLLISRAFVLKICASASFTLPSGGWLRPDGGGCDLGCGVADNGNERVAPLLCGSFSPTLPCLLMSTYYGCLRGSGISRRRCLKWQFSSTPPY